MSRKQIQAKFWVVGRVGSQARLGSVCIPSSEGDTPWMDEGAHSLLNQQAVTSLPGRYMVDPVTPVLPSGSLLLSPLFCLHAFPVS